MFRFEHKREPVVSSTVFVGRLIWSTIIGGIIIGASLVGGMAGYMTYAHLGMTDAFLNAAMILGGMGPVATLDNDMAKIFAGAYALYAGLILIAVSGIILAPAIHRVLHSLHAEDQD